MPYLLASIIILILFWPLIRKWLFSFIANRAEDMIRKQMGAPSRKEEKKARRESENNKTSGRFSRRNAAYNHSAHKHIPFPKEYAVDVEFTEIKEFSQTEITGSSTKDNKWSFSRKSTVIVESQISDVEFIELK